MHWLRPHHIRAVSETCTKGRYDVRGDMVRATYAHTVEIELDLPSDDTPNLLYYPCSDEMENLHLEHGIKPGDRKHVHLSKTITAAANAGHVHHHRPVIIEVDCIQMEANGDNIYHAGTTVYLTEEVEARYCAIVEDSHPELLVCISEWEEVEAAREEERQAHLVCKLNLIMFVRHERHTNKGKMREKPDVFPDVIQFFYRPMPSTMRPFR